MIDIIELGAICNAQAAASRRAFEALGRWVTIERDPTLQRLWSAASHRHAWHAELWLERLPSIPPVQAEAPSPGEESTPDPTGYGRDLATTRAELAALRARVDPHLDPSTVRVVDLVDADLADLESRLATRLATRLA